MKCVKFVAASIALAWASAVYAGPLGRLYLTYTESSVGGRGGGIAVVQGSSISSFAVAYNSQFEIPIAVDGDVRTAGYFAGTPGGQYTLAGAPTSTTYTNPLVDGTSYDSTTDGTYNYLVDFNSGGVYATGRDFTSPMLLFNTGSEDLGITYDETNNSLWISGWDSTVVTNYAMNGTVLGSFSTEHTNNGALALDHADQTLWLVNNSENGTLEQYSKAGVLLGTGPNVGNTLGGDFDFAAAVPEPPTLALFGLGLAGLGFSRRKQ